MHHQPNLGYIRLLLQGRYVDSQMDALVVSIWDVLRVSSIGRLLQICVAAGVVGGCQQHEKVVLPDSCFIDAREGRMFVGAGECMQALPQHEISGYWVSGFEYSVLYLERGELTPKFDESATWLSFKSAEKRIIASQLREGQLQFFAITFIGSISDMPGYYGAGNFGRGAWVERIVRLEELRVPD